MAAETAKVEAWMPLWIGDLLAETMGLTRELIGGYMLLLFAYWRNKGPLPDDDEAFAAIVRASLDEWRDRLRPRLVPFFMLQASAWHHARTDQELAKAGRNKEVAVEKARKAAEARWGAARPKADAPGNAPSIPQGDAGACPKVTPSPSPSPTTSSLRSEGESARSKRVDSGAPSIPDVPAELVADWLVVRKAKRAGALTATAIEAVQREAAKAGITPHEAIRCCCEAAWITFRADWYAARTGGSRAPGSATRSAGSPIDRTATRRMETFAELTGQRAEREPRGGFDVIDTDARVID